MAKKDEYINAAELLGGFLLKWLVSKMLGIAESPSQLEPFSEEYEPREHRKTAEIEPGFWSLAAVLEYAAVAKSETLNAHIKGGYFPAHAKLEGDRKRWASADLMRWSEWKSRHPYRDTYKQWIAGRPSGERFE